SKLAAHIGFDSRLIYADFVAPCPDNGAVGTCDGRNAVHRAAGRLELELVGEHRPMESVLEFLRNVVNNVLGIDAGPLATGHAQAAFRGSHIRARAAEV